MEDQEDQNIQPINKKRITLLILANLALIIFAVLYFVFDNRSDTKPPVLEGIPEYAFTFCQGEYCIKGKQVGNVNCGTEENPIQGIMNERQERICGDYVLMIDSRIKIGEQE